MKVFVINMHGEPLMPCSPRKARLLLKEGKAIVVQREPFTIQLLHGSTGYKQDITVGVDTGHTDVGVSIITPTEEIGSYVFKLRNDISKKLASRLMYRRTRRNRLRYRECRFRNRTASRRKGRLAPSVQWKVDAHIRIIDLLQSRLPKFKLILETASFDIGKIINPNITKEQYQKGAQYGYQNVKAFVLDRDKHKCHYNNTKCSDKLEVHHIKFRIHNGSDTPTNLITLCDKHHKELHDNKISLEVKKHLSFKAETTMNIIRSRLLKHYPCATETFGYITKQNRQLCGIEKSHENDAFIIAGGQTQKRNQVQNWQFKQNNNRAIGINRKGFAPTARKVRYKIQPKDIIEYNGINYKSKGTLNKGKAILLNIEGINKGIAIKNIKLIYNRKSILQY